ncbi:transposase [Sinorhizobium americanum]|uniref:DDE family transposase n=1 Tax=Sinorhizobium americanum TaxID=194963 RepID=A0A4R2BVP1_9HYPH|nr:transposase [Sinorhizobium americanum]TCN30219.1 DDE family transposase [Sinorhizobium americanum]
MLQLDDGRLFPAIALEVTPGQRGDVHVAIPLLTALPPSDSCAADTAYDAEGLRKFLLERGTIPVIPNNPTRRCIHPFDRSAYKRRNAQGRIATRYDKLARNFMAAVELAATIIWWCD